MPQKTWRLLQIHPLAILQESEAGLNQSKIQAFYIVSKCTAKTG